MGTVLRREWVLAVVVVLSACGSGDFPDALGSASSAGRAPLTSCAWDPRFGLESCVQGEWWVEFSVRDSGDGVPAEMIERIYEAFYSTKSEGMGIGLKLCRSIVESHHGRMQVRNIYNGTEVAGCCFSFWIPVVSRLRPEGLGPNSPPQTLTDIERAR